MDIIKPNDIECREPIIIESPKPDGLKTVVPLLDEVALLDDVALRRIRGVVESLAVGAIFTTLGLLIWMVC
jgi:hypothetical protein